MKWIKQVILFVILTLSWRRSQSYRNQSIDLLCKSMDWFLYDGELPDEIVKEVLAYCVWLILLFLRLLMI